MAEQQASVPGRPRDLQARRKVLTAALDLVDVDGMAGASIEAISRLSGVSKQTIYRWWPNSATVVLEALLEVTAKSAPYRDTGDTAQDLQRHCRRYIRLLTGPHGKAYQSLIGAAQTSPETQQAIRSQLLAPRRAETTRILQLGIDRGQLRPDTDIDATTDQLYAPLIYRLLVGHAPLNNRTADTIVRQLMHGLAIEPPAG
jgi:AcrR family transcriptional regulator